MNVSIIIPAYNAAETIADTLDSVLAQTSPNWEAIIVDDGSTDGTASIAVSFAKRDARFRTVSQPALGVSAARNAGIRLARSDWLLFLDADDWILPRHLERLTSTLSSDPDLDAVHCGWGRVTRNGMLYGESYGPPSSDLFTAFACFPAFVIHACIVRRSLVEAVGGFDASFSACEDWDLWQRIARTGARFGAIREVLAHYRVRLNSASSDGLQMLCAGLRVITMGHSSDPRVLEPHPSYAAGIPTEGLQNVKFYFACWCAGLVIGRGGDTGPLLGLLKEGPALAPEPTYIAHSIFESVLVSTSCPPNQWVGLWPSLATHIRMFLLDLQAQLLIPGLARSVSTALERMILEHSTELSPVTIGITHAVRVEVTEPIEDIVTPLSAERLYCKVHIDGESIGSVELPVCDGFLLGYVLADSIAADFAWPLIGRFFERSIYPNLRAVRGPGGVALWRSNVCLADGLPANAETDRASAHDQIGWTIFLQEIWGRPEWPDAHFYDPAAGAGQEHNNSQEAWRELHHQNGWITVDVVSELPNLIVGEREIDVVFTVGGTALGVATISPERGRVTAQMLRATLTASSGFELCRAVVREGLLGRPLTEPLSLRERLVRVAVERGYNAISPIFRHALPSGEHFILLGRRNPELFGTSDMRRAMLPAAVTRDVIDAAAETGDPVGQVLGSSGKPARVVYVPELISHASQVRRGKVAERNTPTPSEATAHGRHYFESLFASQADPWRYTNAYEQRKYEQTLALLPSPIKRALELACAEGHFTVQLAPRVDHLMAADISKIALARAALRCASLKNIEFTQLDMLRDSLPGRFDLIVCSEVLYYTDGRAELESVAKKIFDALEPGGYLLTAHANSLMDEPDQPGFDWNNISYGAKAIGETFASVPDLGLVKEIRTPLYRVQLFQRNPPDSSPEVIEADLVLPLPPEVAAHVRWQGGVVATRDLQLKITTACLPILMYHRVTPSISPAMARWRIMPEALEEQLCYLRDSGFYTVRLEEWHSAMKDRRPLPGRAILLTFDDGYLDFLNYAWPLLKRFQFSARFSSSRIRSETLIPGIKFMESRCPFWDGRKFFNSRTKGSSSVPTARRTPISRDSLLRTWCGKESARG